MGIIREITDKGFRKEMDRHGLSHLHLIKGEGYFYVISDGDDLKENTSIYINSFKQQDINRWVEDIKDLRK